MTNHTNRESSIESLDRIHTFNLRNTAQTATEVSKPKFIENDMPLGKKKKEEEQQDYMKKANFKNIDLIPGPKVSLGGKVPATEDKPRESIPHNRYCDEELVNIENKQNLPSYPATSNNAAFINKNLYVEESVKVLEQIILKADPLL